MVQFIKNSRVIKMAKKELFDFKHNNKTVKAYKGESTSDVYFKVGDGTATSAGLTYNQDTGTFTTKSGSSLKWEDAEKHVRDKL